MSNKINIEYQHPVQSVFTIKQEILKQMDLFKESYQSYPRYAIISELQLQLLQCDADVYLWHNEQSNFTRQIFGLEICVSERIRTINDIEVF